MKGGCTWNAPRMCPHTDLHGPVMGPASREYPKYRIPSSLSREIPLAEPSGVASCTARRRSPANIVPMPPRPPPRSAALPARKSTVASSERGVARHPGAYPSSSSSGAPSSDASERPEKGVCASPACGEDAAAGGARRRARSSRALCRALIAARITAVPRRAPPHRPLAVDCRRRCRLLTCSH